MKINIALFYREKITHMWSMHFGGGPINELYQCSKVQV